MSNVWEQLGRRAGEILLGDQLWTKNGKALLVVLRKSNVPGLITLQQARALYKNNEIAKIADEQGIIYDL